MSAASKQQKSPWKFKNALMINLTRFDGLVTHSEVLLAVRELCSEDELHGVLSVGQYSGNKIWTISFKDAASANALVGKSIRFRDRECLLFDPNKPRPARPASEPRPRTRTIRLIYLPPNIGDDTIVKFMSSFDISELSVANIEDEKCKVKGFEHINNGIKKVTIRYNNRSDELVQSMSGAVNFFGLKAIILVAGQKDKCHFCAQEGHILKNCPLKSLECGNCKQKGHVQAKCSIAERLKALSRNQIDYSDFESADLLVEKEPDPIQQMQKAQHDLAIEEQNLNEQLDTTISTDQQQRQFADQDILSCALAATEAAFPALATAKPKIAFDPQMKDKIRESSLQRKAAESAKVAAVSILPAAVTNTPAGKVATASTTPITKAVVTSTKPTSNNGFNTLNETIAAVVNMAAGSTSASSSGDAAPNSAGSHSSRKSATEPAAANTLNLRARADPINYSQAKIAKAPTKPK